MYPLHGAVWTDAASIDQGLNAPRREEVCYPAGLAGTVRRPIPDRPGGWLDRKTASTTGKHATERHRRRPHCAATCLQRRHSFIPLPHTRGRPQEPSATRLGVQTTSTGTPNLSHGILHRHPHPHFRATKTLQWCAQLQVPCSAPEPLGATRSPAPLLPPTRWPCLLASMTCARAPPATVVPLRSPMSCLIHEFIPASNVIRCGADQTGGRQGCRLERPSRRRHRARARCCSEPPVRTRDDGVVRDGQLKRLQWTKGNCRRHNGDLHEHRRDRSAEKLDAHDRQRRRNPGRTGAGTDLPQCHVHHCADHRLLIQLPRHERVLDPVSYTHLTLPTICSV